MMAKQLTIFEVEPDIVALDLQKANVKFINKENAYTDVIVAAPSKRDYESFEHICYCFWKKLKCSWEEAVRMVSDHIEKKKEIKIRIPIRNGRALFTPNVVRYV